MTLEKATKLAFKKAAISKFKNYVILLSPSAASFDQYRNFEDRGNKFKELVNQQLSESLIKWTLRVQTDLTLHFGGGQ